VNVADANLRINHVVCHQIEIFALFIRYPDCSYASDSAFARIAAADSPLLIRSSAGDAGMTCNGPASVCSMLFFFRFITIIGASRNRSAARLSEVQTQS
jgi:hypothetical protein